MAPQTGRRSDLILGAAGLALGAVAAAAYAAWRAVTANDAAWQVFGEALLFPGLLIIAAIAVMVWLGWKANID